MNRLAVLLLLLTLGACAPMARQQPAQPPPGFAGPRLEADAVIAADGARLGLSTWNAATEPWAVIVAAHGMNDYANAFHIAAPKWAEQGVTTYAYDQRGFGRSPGRGIWAGDELMIDDLRTVTALARARYPRAIIAVVGESMGGSVAAAAFATPEMASALTALTKFYRTGDTADRVAYDIAWVQDKVSPVDTINGFIEVYLDPRGIKGGWEALVFYVNQEKTSRIKTIATNAQWFEDRMPWDAKYRKASVQGIVANAIDVVVETGDSGPVTPIGINLPNDQGIREKFGSKSVALSNVNEAYDRSTPGSMRGEFVWSPDEAARATTCGTLAGELTTDMHEVIGHASGQQAPGKGNPQTLIKEEFSALEEGRADLVGLYFIADPKMVELGIIPAADHDAMIRTEYEAYTRNALVQLRRMREGSQIEEDHMRNRQMIVRWLMANTKAIEDRTRDGKTYLVMVDQQAFRAGVGKLLAEVQRIKSEGDYAAAKKLFATYGVHFDPKLRDQVVARVDKLNLPSYTGFVMPKLTPVMTNGQMTDVAISYPQDLTQQMLEYSGVRKR